MAMLAALAGCSGSSDPAVPPPPSATTPVVPPAAAPSPVSAVVGAAGATIAGPDGFELVVPPGALAQDTTVTIARSGNGAPGLPVDSSALAPGIEITPHGLQFQLPVTMRMPFNPPAGAPAAGVWIAGPGDDWTDTRATVANGMATWTRQSLSWAQPTVCAPPANATLPCVFPRANAGLSTVPPGSAALTPVYAQPTFARWRLTAATTVRLTTVYDAAIDCQNPRLTIRRGNGVAPPTFVFDANVPFAPETAQRAGGTVTFDLPLTAADNGRVALSMRFSCNRPGKPAMTDGYAHVIDVDIAPSAAAPTIAQPPASQTLQVGQDATFSVVATAPDAISYAWQLSSDGGQTWADAPGATGASFTLPAVTLADNGKRVRARVCNTAPAGTTCIDSAAADLTVVGAQASWGLPTVITGPSSLGFPAAGIDAQRRTLALVVGYGSVGRMVASRGAVGASWGALNFIDVGLPSGADSYEPQLAVAPGGSAVAVWGYFAGGRYGVGANRFDGTNWGTALRLDVDEAGNSSDQRVAIDDSGRAIAVWQQALGSRYGVRARIHNGSWGATLAVDRGVASFEPRVAVDAQGRGFILFKESGALLAAAVDLAAGTVGTPVTLATMRSFPADLQFSMDPSGHAVAAWIEDIATGGYDVRVARHVPNSGWQAPETLAIDVGFWRDLAAAAGPSGVAFVAWVQEDPVARKRAVYARRHASGSGWSPTERRSAAGVDLVRSIQLVTGASGRAVLSWMQRTTSGSEQQTWAQVYEGGWGTPQAVQTSAFSAEDQVPVVVRSLAMAPDGAAVLLWREYTTNNVVLGAYLQ